MAAPTLVIMAAGMGSRYGGLKQIDPIGPNGEIVIDYSIYDAIKAGFGKVVFIIRREIEEAFKEKIGNNIAKLIKVEYVFQDLDALPYGFSLPEGRGKPWGTGHAILCCKDVVNEPFGVINADDFYGYSSYKMLADYLKTASDKDDIFDYSLVGYVLKNTLSDNGHVARGVCEADASGYLADIKERLKIQRFDDGVKFEIDDKWTDVSENSIVSMNMWGFTPSLFEELEKSFIPFLEKGGKEMKSEYLLPEIVGNMVEEKVASAKILSSDEIWFGVTYQEDKPIVQNAVKDMITAGKYPEQLWG